MKNLETLTTEELIKEFLDAHQKYMEATADFHIYLPRTRGHIEAEQLLDKIVGEIRRRKNQKPLFS